MWGNSRDCPIKSPIYWGFSGLSWIHENKTNTTDGTGTYPHYIWVVVEGGANEDIATIIYNENLTLEEYIYMYVVI